MEGGHLVRDLPDLPVEVDPGLGEVGQATLGRHAAHHDEVVAHLAIGVEHVGHAEVDVRGEATVQLDLAVAHRFPSGAGAEVEEARDRPAS